MPELLFAAEFGLAAAWGMNAGQDRNAHSRALEALRQSADLAKQLNAPESIAAVAHNSAMLRLNCANCDDEVEVAIAELRAALKVRRNCAPAVEAETLLGLGAAFHRRRIGTRRDNLNAARRHLRDSADTFQRTPGRGLDLAVSLAHLSIVEWELARGQSERQRAAKTYLRARRTAPQVMTMETALLSVLFYATTLKSENFEAALDVTEAIADLNEAHRALRALGATREADQAMLLLDRVRRPSMPL